jgi:hypothetical protein
MSNEKQISHGRGRWQRGFRSLDRGPWLHRLVRLNRGLFLNKALPALNKGIIAQILDRSVHFPLLALDG